MSTVLSGVRPTGDMHLGNYLGAFKSWVTDQESYDSYYCIVDLHALAEDFEPKELRERIVNTAIVLLSVGLDPEKCTLFIQSSVPEHAQLTWFLSCITGFGELNRMTQFKDKSKNNESTKVGLFTYPVLMAADILLYQADRVPVGEDQKQHLELTRDLAIRFNSRFGATFKVPEPAIPTVGARIMDLQDPSAKMSKSTKDSSGVIYVLDTPSTVEKKIKRAVTDSESEVYYDPAKKPGVSNLLELLGASTGEDPKQLGEKYTNYGSLKKDCAEAVNSLLAPVKDRANALYDDRGAVKEILRLGAQKAHEKASSTFALATSRMGISIDEFT